MQISYISDCSISVWTKTGFKPAPDIEAIMFGSYDICGKALLYPRALFKGDTMGGN